MFPVMSGENIKLTGLLSNELFKKVLNIYFSYTLPYIDKILSTSKCRYSYRQHMKMGVVSLDSSCPQLGLIKISD